MNKKIAACVIIGLLMAAMFQTTAWMNQRMKKRHDDAVQARQVADLSATQLIGQQRQLVELRTNSKSLIDYLALWEPYFKEVDSGENAELKISLRIKQANLVSLSQRYEVVALKGNPSLVQAMRAHLTFEDNYVRLLNWLGQLEAQLPTMRIGSLRITKGTRPDDIKINTVLELPLTSGK